MSASSKPATASVGVKDASFRPSPRKERERAATASVSSTKAGPPCRFAQKRLYNTHEEWVERGALIYKKLKADHEAIHGVDSLGRRPMPSLRTGSPVPNAYTPLSLSARLPSHTATLSLPLPSQGKKLKRVEMHPNPRKPINAPQSLHKRLLPSTVSTPFSDPVPRKKSNTSSSQSPVRNVFVNFSEIVEDYDMSFFNDSPSLHPTVQESVQEVFIQESHAQPDQKKWTQTFWDLIGAAATNLFQCLVFAAWWMGMAIMAHAVLEYWGLDWTNTSIIPKYPLNEFGANYNNAYLPSKYLTTGNKVNNHSIWDVTPISPFITSPYDVDWGPNPRSILQYQQRRNEIDIRTTVVQDPVLQVNATNKTILPDSRSVWRAFVSSVWLCSYVRCTSSILNDPNKPPLN